MATDLLIERTIENLAEPTRLERLGVGPEATERWLFPVLGAQRGIPRHAMEPRRIRSVWRKASDSLLARLLDPVWFWMMLGSYEDQPLVLDRWQVIHLRNMARLRAVEKSPQIGFSLLCALEALHECLMFEDATSGFVSVDQREATEKILYARKAYSELPAWVHEWVPLTKATTDEMHFGDPARPSRLLSIPATSALRGRRMNVYLDEVDFYRDGGEDAHRVALGRITRGGRITMGSTCFGVDTQLDKTMTAEQTNFSRARYPWTMAENEDALATCLIARAEMAAAAFDEEYNAVRGSSGGTFPPSVIKAAQHGFPHEDPFDWEPSGPLVGGFDVGQTTHPSILSLAEKQGESWKQRTLYEVVDESGKMLSLPAQHRFLQRLLRERPTLRQVVDGRGVGAHIGEALTEEFGQERVIIMMPGSKGGDDLPTQERVELVTDFKRGIEDGAMSIVVDLELTKQMSRTRIISGRVDQPGSKKKTHYDKFWATAYMWYGTRVDRTLRSAYEKHGVAVLGLPKEDRWAS